MVRSINFAIGQAFASRIAAPFGPRKQHDAEIVEAHPNPAAAVLKHGILRVAGQPFGFSVHHENIVAPPAETAVGANPEVAFAILKQAAHADRKSTRLNS